MIEERYIALIHASLDGELSDRDQAMLDQFLAGSEEGRSYRASLDRLVRTLDSFEEPKVPIDLRDRIVQSIPTVTRRQPTPAWQKRAFALAAGIVLAVALLLVMRPYGIDEFEQGSIGTMAGQETLSNGLNVSGKGFEAQVSLVWREAVLVVEIGIESTEPITTTLEFPEDQLEVLAHDGMDVAGGSLSVESSGKQELSARLQPRTAGQRVSDKLSVSFVQNSKMVGSAALSIPTER